MRVLIDTNVLFSAALNPNGTTFQAYVKAVTPPNTGIICRQNIEELRRTFNRKLPHKIQALESFLAVSMLMLEVVPVPETVHAIEEQVRDVNDRPILRAAIHAKADVILTGDKDLLEADLKRPLACTPAQFLDMCPYPLAAAERQPLICCSRCLLHQAIRPANTLSGSQFQVFLCCSSSPPLGFLYWARVAFFRLLCYNDFMNELDTTQKKLFDDLRHIDENGNEYWLARELQTALQYTKWENFHKVIKTAQIACKISQQSVADCFPEVRKSIISGKGRKSEIIDYKLTRYACCLIVMNGDPRKDVIAWGQTYFAVKTRQQELAELYERLSEDEKRLFIRGDIRQKNMLLAEAAKKAGIITSLEYATFQDAGYRGLYGGMTAQDIAENKGLKDGEEILDFNQVKAKGTRPERRLLCALRLILIAIPQWVLLLRLSPQFIAKCALSGCKAIASG